MQEQTGPFEDSEATPRPKERTSKSAQESKLLARDIIETLVLTLIIFFGIRFMVQNFKVEGQSMEPSMHDGEYVLVSKVSYMIHAPHRGDVAVFKFPLDTSRSFIKRVIAIPGDTVAVSNGRVIVDGQRLTEPYIYEPPDYNYPAHKVSANEYFVLGDNRTNSYDSHSWGMVPANDLIGQAWVVYWPRMDWQFIPTFSKVYAAIKQ